VINGALHFTARPDYLGFQDSDTSAQLGDRQRVKILPCQFRERIARLFREILVQIHKSER